MEVRYGGTGNERESAMANEFLTTYLNDHLAGAEMALEIVALLRDIDDSSFWREMGNEIESDRRELQRLMESTNQSESRLRRAAAWLTEKLAELKTRVDDRSRDGALRRLELIEALALGIDGKRALWTALQTVSERAPELDLLDYDNLIVRARAQRVLVETRRLRAATDALRPAVRLDANAGAPRSIGAPEND